MLGLAAARDRAVGEAEVLELPVEADGRVAARAEIAEEAVLAPAEPAARVAEGQAGDQGAEPRLLQPQQGGLDQLLRRGQLGTLLQALDDQVVERACRRGRAG